MKADQIAFYVHNERQEQDVKEQLGLQDAEWVHDIVEGYVSVWHQAGPWVERRLSRAKLAFCYEREMEIELLTYLEGPHWHEKKSSFIRRQPFVSHLGFHMDPGEKAPRSPLSRPVQVMDTFRHTNPYLLEKRRTYHYEIFDSTFGIDLKYIWRNEP